MAIRRHRRQPMFRSATASLLLLGCLALLGCDTPDDPLAQEIFLEGELEPAGRATHDVVLQDTGLVEFELLRYDAEVLETGDVLPLPTALGFAIGTSVLPDGETEPDCQGGAAAFLRTGDALVLLLERTSFCVQLFDTVGIPENTIALYTLRARTTE